MKNKKGVSIMVGYVLLVVIAIGLSVGVYQFLKLQVPKERSECPADIHVIIEAPECNVGLQEAKLNITNRGLFKIDGAYIRFGLAVREIKDLINERDEIFEVPLNPEQTLKYSSGAPVSSGEYAFEVQPIVIDEKGIWIACSKAIVTQKVTC